MPNNAVFEAVKSALMPSPDKEGAVGGEPSTVEVNDEMFAKAAEMLDIESVDVYDKDVRHKLKEMLDHFAKLGDPLAELKKFIIRAGKSPFGTSTFNNIYHKIRMTEYEDNTGSGQREAGSSDADRKVPRITVSIS